MRFAYWTPAWPPELLYHPSPAFYNPAEPNPAVSQVQLEVPVFDAMRDMDIDRADEMVVQIQKFRYPELLAPVVEKLGNAVANIDEGQAAIRRF